MLDIQQKRKVRAIMYHRASIGVLFVMVLLVLHSTWVVYEKKMSSEDMKEVALDNVLGLRQRSSDLDSKIDSLATVSGVEEEIRSKFSVAKDSESIVVVVPTNEKSASTTTPKSGFWQSFKSLFFQKK